MITVVCTGGEFPSEPLCRQALERADFVIAADGGIELTRSLGLAVDLWIGDRDSLKESVGDYETWSRKQELLPRAKDDTDTEAATRRAIELGATSLLLLGGGGQRMDHWLANLALVSRTPELQAWWTAHETIEIVAPGESLELSPGVVSVFPLGTGPWTTQATGFRWSLESVDFGKWHSLSNEILPGTKASFTSVSGRFMILRPFVAEVAP